MEKKNKNNRLKLLLLHWIGRGYFILLVIGIIALLLGSHVARRLGPLPLLIIFFGLMKGYFSAIFTKISTPEGVEVNKKTTPVLFELIEEIRTKLNCPKIHEVKLDLSFNAYVAEIPKLGNFGFYRRYLVIGIPLMLILSKEELTALLGHEIGHLSKSHGKMSVRVLRGANVWRKTAEQLKKSGNDKNFLIKPFITKYIPELNDAMLSLWRENEFEADESATNVTDSATTASVLLKLSLYDSFLDEVFWREVDNQVAIKEKPPANLFNQMEKLCETPLNVEDSKEVLSHILSVRSLPCWTHPSIYERLENIEVQPELPKHTKHNALRAVFGEEADNILEKANEYWVSNVSQAWTEKYKSLEKLKLKLNKLNEKSNTEMSLTQDEEIEKALLIEQLKGVEEGLKAFNILQKINPNNLSIAYHLGRLMIITEKQQGKDILHKVMKVDPQLIPQCCDVLYNYNLGKGEINEAIKYYSYAIKFMMTNKKVENERRSVSFSDSYSPHDLDIDTIKEIRKKLLKSGHVNRAYIGIKSLKESGQFPLYIILVKLKSEVRSKSKEISQEIADYNLVPWQYFVIPIQGKNKDLEYKFTDLSNSRII